jgi:hypothetical protein
MISKDLILTTYDYKPILESTRKFGNTLFINCFFLLESEKFKQINKITSFEYDRLTLFVLFEQLNTVHQTSLLIFFSFHQIFLKNFVLLMNHIVQ